MKTVFKNEALSTESQQILCFSPCCISCNK